MAITAMMFGSSAGFLILPLLFRHLQDTYGFYGSTLIYGALIFHTVVAASVLHPVKWHSKRVNELVDAEIKTNGGNYKQSSFDDNNEEMQHLNKSEKCDADNDLIKPVIKKPYRIIVILKVFKTVAVATYRNFAQFKNRRVTILAISGGFFVSGCLNYVLMVSFTIAAHGFSLQTAAYCLSLFAICNATSRLIIPVISDMRWFNVCYFYMGGILVTALSMIVSSLVKDLKWIMIAMSLFGAGIGSSMGLFTLVIIDVMGLENLPSTFSLMSFVVASIFIITGPVVGLIRDVTDSYKVSNAILGGMVLFSFSLWLLMPFAKRYDKERVRRKT